MSEPQFICKAKQEGKCTSKEYCAAAHLHPFDVCCEDPTPVACPCCSEPVFCVRVKE